MSGAHAQFQTPNFKHHQVREVELNMDMASVLRLLDFLEALFNGGEDEGGGCGTSQSAPPGLRQGQRGLTAPALATSLTVCVCVCLCACARHAHPCPRHPNETGSDFNEPLKRCLSRLTDAKWANSDILLVSGERRGCLAGPVLIVKTVRSCSCQLLCLLVCAVRLLQPKP
jgi:hypothetical protein